MIAIAREKMLIGFGAASETVTASPTCGCVALDPDEAELDPVWADLVLKVARQDLVPDVVLISVPDGVGFPGTLSTAAQRAPSFARWLRLIQ